jgi:hypothetical protein
MIRWSFSERSRWVKVVGVAVVVVAGAAATGGCAPRGDVAPAPGRINHVVFFELEDPTEAEALIADSLRLGAIPGVTACYAGRHVDTGRTTVLQDYDVGFFVAFDSEEDYASYVRRPEHVALIEKWRPRLRALRVYDILDEREAK